MIQKSRVEKEAGPVEPLPPVQLGSGTVVAQAVGLWLGDSAGAACGNMEWETSFNPRAFTAELVYQRGADRNGKIDTWSVGEGAGSDADRTVALAVHVPESIFRVLQMPLDHILSPPPMPFRKCSNPDVASGPGKSLKYKRQLSEDGRQLRRGSLGGALTGRYLLPNPVAGQAWPASAETSNLVRMRSQALGQSAPSLTASLVSVRGRRWRLL
ncbi:PREDICTED: uncharacterized protein LOC105539988 [Mandrillus leucophaeus]|nr:PREDICTED: uncharacterized protein LOC105539988 [Mandrillus leucophaeus]